MAERKITVRQHLDKMRADPQYVEMRKEKAAKRAARRERLRIEQQPLLKDLRSVGLRVESVWDLVNTEMAYPEAVPLLLEHFERKYDDRIREGIARALAVPEATFAWPRLVTAYVAAPTDSGVKDGLAVAISVVAHDGVVEELIQLLKDAQNGGSRLLMLDGLKKSNLAIARDLIRELQHDPVFAKEIASWRKSITY